MQRFCHFTIVSRIAAAVLFGACALAPQAARADTVRVEKIKQLAGPHGETLWLERFYGSSGWHSVQLKNTAGAIVAYAPIAPYNGVFCPSLDTCLVFPNGALQYLVPAWRLDVVSLKYDMANPVAAAGAATPADGADGGAADYQSYLQYDTVRDYAGPEIGTPDQRLGAQGFVRAQSYWWGLASFLFVLPDSPLLYALLLIAGYATVRVLQRRKRRRERALANGADVTGS